MSNKESVDKDLREYLSKADNLRNIDKMNYLRAIFDKHFTFTKLDHLIVRHDLFSIVSDAKSNYVRQNARPTISGKQIDSSEVTHVAVINAFISYLNKNGLLNKHVDFDYTDESDQYEVLD